MLFNNVNLTHLNQELKIRDSIMNTSSIIKFQVHNKCGYNLAPISNDFKFEPENDHLLQKYEQAWRDLANL